VACVQYVALLRGIGPGNPNMRNEKLRGVLEGLGFANVASVISTGNLVFEADANADPAELEAEIQAAWPKRLGFESTTIVRSRPELQRLIAGNPFGETEDAPTSRLHVSFLKRAPQVELELPYRDPKGGYEIVTIEDRAICSVIDTTGQNRTPEAMRWLERTFGKEITMRTWRTVHRIAAKMGAQADAPAR